MLQIISNDIPCSNPLKVSGSNCTQVRDIFVSKLSRKEKEDALKDASEADLKKSMLEIQTRYFEKQDRRYSSEKAKKVVDGFMAFGGIFMQVVSKALSNAPAEYGAAFAVVNCIYKVRVHIRHYCQVLTQKLQGNQRKK